MLVVEDDPAIRRGVVDALEASGYRAIESADGEAALGTGLAREPDLVLLDIMLPKRDGFSVLAELRRARPALRPHHRRARHFFELSLVRCPEGRAIGRTD